ncbi:DUF6284 family protein [Actinoplanes sp. TRM 88003]|uniref:DUF6284 family protein n=1 Tax=Paractinoplanes aksuensis TaxID=2939490 RepID=A0ABT1DPU6_9ACTN|nr:DUF6284 family protein [Actinoplanes aksuensis]MCO8272820.1 DUF6284 family protein [Actinoplanes aksuensis]
MSTHVPHDGEPSPTELAEIEAEQPLLDAEVAWLDAEIAILAADSGPSDLDWRRVRRAEGRVIRETFAHVARRRFTRPGPRRAA